MHERDKTASPQRILDLPRGFGESTDMTFVIDARDQAGRPGDEVTSFHHLTLRGGRVAPVTDGSPLWPALSIDEDPPRYDRVFIDDASKSAFSEALL
ncbi:hypothetical protein [Frondihabitans australicus]|uniref:Uncharacterized protein n=1 Tax=Frondihabitans australicus TaxID=386892 RepID=A0A495IKP5_9MICO|nr:hypothetical protein [Frondihabitans australicus]RKR76310.1 hypothetical protein C8E83_3479 [Frondihabitans australicus]